MAAKGYFDALVKLGELASDSQGSKELGEWGGGGSWRRTGLRRKLKKKKKKRHLIK